MVIPLAAYNMAAWTVCRALLRARRVYCKGKKASSGEVLYVSAGPTLYLHAAGSRSCCANAPQVARPWPESWNAPDRCSCHSAHLLRNELAQLQRGEHSCLEIAPENRAVRNEDLHTGKRPEKRQQQHEDCSGRARLWCQAAMKESKKVAAKKLRAGTPGGA